MPGGQKSVPGFSKKGRPRARPPPDPFGGSQWRQGKQTEDIGIPVGYLSPQSVDPEIRKMPTTRSQAPGDVRGLDGPTEIVRNDLEAPSKSAILVPRDATDVGKRPKMKEAAIEITDTDDEHKSSARNATGTTTKSTNRAGISSRGHVTGRNEEDEGLGAREGHRRLLEDKVVIDAKRRPVQRETTSYTAGTVQKPLGHGASGYAGIKTALFIQSEHVRRHARSTKDKAPSRDLEQRALDRGRVERQAAGITNAMSNSSDRRRPGPPQSIGAPYDPSVSRRQSSAAQAQPTSSSPFHLGRDSTKKKKSTVHLSPTDNIASSSHRTDQHHRSVHHHDSPTSVAGHRRIISNTEFMKEKNRADRTGLFDPNHAGPSTAVYDHLRPVIHLDESDGDVGDQPSAMVPPDERVHRRSLGEPSNGDRNDSSKRSKQQIPLSASKGPPIGQRQLDFSYHAVRSPPPEAQGAKRTDKNVIDASGTSDVEILEPSSPDPLALRSGDSNSKFKQAPHFESPEPQEDVNIIPGLSPHARARKRDQARIKRTEATNHFAELNLGPRAAQTDLAHDPITSFDDADDTSRSRKAAPELKHRPRPPMMDKDGRPANGLKQSTATSKPGGWKISELTIFDGETKHDCKKKDVFLHLNSDRTALKVRRTSRQHDPTQSAVSLATKHLFEGQCQNISPGQAAFWLVPKEDALNNLLGYLGEGQLFMGANRPHLVTLKFSCRDADLRVIQTALGRFDDQPGGNQQAITSAYEQIAKQGYDSLKKRSSGRHDDVGPGPGEDALAYDVVRESSKHTARDAKKRAAQDPPQTRSNKRRLVVAPSPGDEDYNPGSNARSVEPGRIRPRREVASYEAEMPNREPSPANRDEVLFSWPLSGRPELTITAGDNSRLREGDFLNDTLIEFGLKSVVKDSGLSDNVHVFSSFFFHKLSAKEKKRDSSAISKVKGNPQQQQEQGLSWSAYDSVRKWTANVDVFSKDFIIVPINEHYHWYLAIIFNPGRVLQPASDKAARPDTVAAETTKLTHHPNGLNSQESERSGDGSVGRRPKEVIHSILPYDPGEKRRSSRVAGIPAESDSIDSVSPRRNANPKLQNIGLDQPLIMILDSLGDAHKSTVNHLNRWLAFEAWDKKKVVVSYGVNEPSAGYRVDVPKQQNLFDCGIYVLHFVEVLLRKPERMMKYIINQATQQSPESRLPAEEVWDQASVPGARQRWRKTIERHHQDWLRKLTAAGPPTIDKAEACSQSSHRSDLELIQAAEDVVEGQRGGDLKEALFDEHSGDAEMECKAPSAAPVADAAQNQSADPSKPNHPQFEPSGPRSAEPMSEDDTPAETMIKANGNFEAESVTDPRSLDAVGSSPKSGARTTPPPVRGPQVIEQMDVDEKDPRKIASDAINDVDVEMAEPKGDPEDSANDVSVAVPTPALVQPVPNGTEESSNTAATQPAKLDASDPLTKSAGNIPRLDQPNGSQSPHDRPLHTVPSPASPAPRSIDSKRSSKRSIPAGTTIYTVPE